jgi:hypothetical protein
MIKRFPQLLGTRYFPVGESCAILLGEAKTNLEILAVWPLRGV